MAQFDVLMCILLLASGGGLAAFGAAGSNANLEIAAGVLIICGLLLLGYELHKITAA